MRLNTSLTSERHPRRGVTLVEMLVTLAVLLLMMTAIVQIFQAATGALTASRAYQEIDANLRRVDGMIRSDLAGITAKMTPPNNPKDDRGYFEYGENSFADLQGEDGDDYLKFTTKAPAGKLFTGRMWPKLKVDTDADGVPDRSIRAPDGHGPITITSSTAEVIYFVRNGNLYRRVLLVDDGRQSAIVPSINNVPQLFTLDATNTLTSAFAAFIPSYFAATVSWQGMNDLSARPAASGGVDSSGPTQLSAIVLNGLGDLTNRENRAFAPRFGNDFLVNKSSLIAGGPTILPDGQIDDENFNGVPDFYPTLYGDIINPGPTNNTLIFEGLVAATPSPPRNGGSFTTIAFPYIFPGAYSKPDPFYLVNGVPTGWIHSPNPDNTTPTSYLEYLQRLNHNPLDVGDNLPPPYSTNGGQQTWWGFPTWRETLSPNWTDPTVQVNVALPLGSNTAVANQPNGLHPHSSLDGNGRVLNNGTEGPHLLPAMTNAVRTVEQPFNDGFGDSSLFGPSNASNTFWGFAWEDDLIMTGVRSFDVKALDPSLGDYVDLGWGDDARQPNARPYYDLYNNTASAPYLTGNPSMSYDGTSKKYVFNSGVFQPAIFIDNVNNTNSINSQPIDLINGTFAHEGRMPPLTTDQRYDSQFGAVASGFYPSPPGNTYTGNVGDDNPNLLRLRRVWDSWSTDYTAAPAKGYDPVSKFPTGPPFSPPVYPSYPPPYPAPLRAIQIQIRVQDATGRYIKSLTLRQDFTGNL